MAVLACQPAFALLHGNVSPPSRTVPTIAHLGTRTGKSLADVSLPEATSGEVEVHLPDSGDNHILAIPGLGVVQQRGN